MTNKRRDTMLKGRHGSSVELLPHDVVELILERLPVEPLLRFRSVSKKWKSTIETRRFQERQLIRRRQSRGPDVLFMSLSYDGLDTDARRFVFGSSIAYTFSFPTLCKSVCHGSCDGLVCLYNVHRPSVSVVVVNPATRWHQTVPLSRTQRLLSKRRMSAFQSKLGFGKDKLRGTYKLVFLYNSSLFGLDNVTTCEVFDFSTHSWRYVRPASPYPIDADYYDPIHLDGSLYWLTECEETKVLSFDLHTETFQVICQLPFAHVPYYNPDSVGMCVLDNRLCVSAETNYPTEEIWSLDSSGGNIKTWKKMCSIDRTKTFPWFGECTASAIAILDKNKLLLSADGTSPLVIHNLHTKSYDLLFKPTKHAYSLCGSLTYFQSLFSA